jgi:hypothetical protein
MDTTMTLPRPGHLLEDLESRRPRAVGAVETRTRKETIHLLLGKPIGIPKFRDRDAILARVGRSSR